MAEKYGDRRPALWGEHLPGIMDTLPPSHPDSTGDTDSPKASPRTLVLTLDACGGRTDGRIIALLREHGVPATIFATNSWLRRNKAVAEDLAADPLFVFACHGKRHRPASVNGRRAYGITGTRNIPALVEEVEDNARAITAAAGTRPGWFRSGTAHYDEVAVAIIRDLGLAVAGYAVSADEGATLPAKEVARRLLNAPDGAVILCHLNHPESGTFGGLAIAIPALLEQGARFAPLPSPSLFP